jgi:hypothetical protein
MNIINVSLAILIMAVVIIVLIPNRWTWTRLTSCTSYNKDHRDLMDAIRKTRR